MDKNNGSWGRCDPDLLPKKTIVEKLNLNTDNTVDQK